MYKARYFPNRDILNASLGNTPSYAWRSICKSIEIIQEGTRWRVGNGKTIHIWDNRRLPTPTTYKVIYPRKDFGDFAMVLALIVQDIRRWRKESLDRIFLAFKVENIFSILIPYYP